jgi:menaquinone-specific isochorismate synthase
VTLAPDLTSTVVRTIPLDEGAPLLSLLPHDEVVSWVRSGEGFVGWGEAARFTGKGPDAIDAARRWWAQLTSTLTVVDEVGVPGSGPVMFASFPFDADGEAVAVLPSVIVARRGGLTWMTTVGHAERNPERTPVSATRVTGFEPGNVDDYREQVSAAVDRIRRGDLTKVVLAGTATVHTADDIDLRHVLARLAADYPECWTFAVDGLVGATPELLVRRRGQEIASRVLAGTTRRGQDAAGDAALRAGLLASVKDHDEHRPAIDAVAEALAPFCSSISVPAMPNILELANVFHLSSDVTGTLDGSPDALELVEALHPTPAVAGSPRPQALAAIAELEAFDRGRYAGPVGWMDRFGDGDWCIALRCALIDGRTATLYAGGGIVAESDPDAEWDEQRSKLSPMRAALGDSGN